MSDALQILVQRRAGLMRQAERERFELSLTLAARAQGWRLIPGLPSMAGRLPPWLGSVAAALGPLAIVLMMRRPAAVVQMARRLTGLCRVWGWMRQSRAG